MTREQTSSSQFLERTAHRRQRLRDAARLLPVLGAAVLLLPDLLLSDPDVAEGATAAWTVYFFVAWAMLILLAFLLAGPLGRDLREGALNSETQGDHSLENSEERPDGP